MPSPTGYAKARDVHIACQPHGAGLVIAPRVPGFISHLDPRLKQPQAGRFHCRGVPDEWRVYTPQAAQA
jgi:hypothetical protein